ncbi:ATP-binding protein [Lysobacter koreensis]|uniref:histidine kinase n=1 Tax=Lysobacter koreensis TaxID=266122 RepID=A0ABW2YPH5_9GAMM
MPNATPVRDTASRLRLPLLALAILLIVVAPFVLVRIATERTLDAEARVTHTREVEAAVHTLLYDVRNRESGAMALAVGIDTPNVRRRVSDSGREIPRGLDRITRLTRDNPEQQVRIGMLRATIDQRRVLVDRMLAGGTDTAQSRDLVEAIVTRYPIRAIADEVIATETALLAARLAQADRLRQRTALLTWGAMLAQLVLLGLVTYFSRRQLARRVEAERDASQASARAQSILQTVREPIVLADATLRVVMHNAAFSELYGINQDDAIGTPLAQVGDGAWDNAETLQRLGDVVSRGRELWDHELAQRTVDGIERTMLVNARKMPLPDSSDHVVLITASDVTAQKAAEQRIVELNRQLEGKVDQVSDVNRELEAFSYSVSHDLRAPLRHISGFADKLARQLGDDADEKSRHYIGVIGSSAKRMATLIDDLLVYSRLGRSALRLQAVDMQSLVAETRALLDSNAKNDNPNHRIEWRIAPMPMLVADENMLRQVWQNLLGNAVKYSAKREPAVIEVEHHPADDGGHHFTVRDNGAGFDMAYAGKLFGVFQRMHKASDYPGTGIGLASVRRVLMRHGGRIWAEAEPERGATFHFTLPAALDHPSNETLP